MRNQLLVIGRRSLILGGAALLATWPPARADGLGTWAVKAPLPIAKFGLHSCVIDDRIFVLGGENLEANSDPTGGLHVYDPANDSWSEAVPMPTARGFLAAAAIEGKIYAVGGSLNMTEQDPGVGTVEISRSQDENLEPGR